jgi:16S rRNA (uracil1498-N3)-methyltransferase
MRKFYQPFSQASVGMRLPLSKETFHHLFTVLRCRENEDLIVFNGQGESWQARLVDCTKKSAMLEWIEKRADQCESPLTIHLAQAVSKGERMDLVMQKATELGVTSITPILTERGNVKLDNDRWEKKIAHWQQILIHACEQSGRTTLPSLHPVTELMPWLSEEREGLKLILSPHATEPLSTLTRPSQVTLLIGPEGGLSPQEMDWAQTRFGFCALKLGPRVLRTETAALTALSVLQYQWGDLS